MKKEDLVHPAFPKFMAHAEEVAYSGEIEDLWNTFLAGYQIGVDHCSGPPNGRYTCDCTPGVAGTCPHRSTTILPEPDAPEDVAAWSKTANNLQFTCARCPDPRNPSPEFHTTGLAHTIPKNVWTSAKAAKLPPK